MEGEIRIMMDRGWRSEGVTTNPLSVMKPKNKRQDGWRNRVWIKYRGFLHFINYVYVCVRLCVCNIQQAVGTSPSVCCCIMVDTTLCKFCCLFLDTLLCPLFHAAPHGPSTFSIHPPSLSFTTNSTTLSCGS